MSDEANSPLGDPGGTRRWIFQAAAALLTIVLLRGVGYFLTSRHRPAPPAARPSTLALRAGDMRGLPQPDRPIVKDFDRNGDKRLDRAERAAAREWLAAHPAGRGFQRFGADDAADAPEPGMRLTPSGVRAYPDAELYDLRTLRTLFLTFDGDDWEEELRAFYGTDVDVPATVVADRRTYPDVGVHFRGNSSYRMVRPGLKHSLNLSFDFADAGQRLGGYRTLNLLNSNNDPTFVRTLLYSEIARHYLPVARANYVRVVINGESWGVYLNVQQFNKDFLRDWYHETGGARWKVPGSPRGRGGLEYLGDDPAAYKRLYEIKTRDDDESWRAFIRLCKVLNQTPPRELQAALEPMLDIDGVLRFLALDVALVNSDGYWTRASDYNIYRDPRGVFHILPHDFNEAFGGERGGRGFGRGGPPPGPELEPLVALDDPGKPLRSKLLAVPALRERYLAYVQEIAERWLDWPTLQPLVREWQALIEPDVVVDTRKIYGTEAFYGDVGSGREGRGADAARTLRGFIERRRAFLLR